MGPVGPSSNQADSLGTEYLASLAKYAKESKAEGV